MGSRSRGFWFILGIVCVGAGAATATRDADARRSRTRDAIQVKVHGEINVPADVFTGRFNHSTNNLTDAWRWDLWCQLQPVIGECKNNVTKYYYDAQLDQCLAFRFSGCGGNKNRFDSRGDCERHCRGAAFVPLKPKEWDSICALQPSAGMCVGFLSKYYFDVNSGRCKQFVFGGCGGNGNQFPGAGACEAQCAGAGAGRARPEPRARAHHTPQHRHRLTLNSSLGLNEFI